MIKKNTIIFIVLSTIASGLNYLVYPIMSRVLSSGSYVDMTVSLSLFTQISTFLSSIIAITIGLSKASEQHDHGNKDIETLQSFLLRAFFVLSVLFLAFSPLVLPSIHTPVKFAVPITLMLMFSIPISIISGYFNGKNLMTKLGIVTLTSAATQFTVAVVVSFITHSGLVVMLSMSIAQLITILLVYRLFSTDKLPRFANIFKPISTPDPATRNLLKFTLITSVAVMVINISQMADLFMVQNLRGVNMKFYTDIFVISRMVFFAGTIFIWPFLGELSITSHHLNRKPFRSLLTYFLAISLGAITILILFGEKLFSLLFGSQYQYSTIVSIGILSVIYKLLLLVITSVVLYYVVMRNYVSSLLSFSTGIVLVGVFVGLDKSSSLLRSLCVLCIASGVMAVISVVTFSRAHLNT